MQGEATQEDASSARAKRLACVLLGVLGNSLDDASAQLEVFGAPMPGTEL